MRVSALLRRVVRIPVYYLIRLFYYMMSRESKWCVAGAKESDLGIGEEICYLQVSQFERNVCIFPSGLKFFSNPLHVGTLVLSFQGSE